MRDEGAVRLELDIDAALGRADIPGLCARLAEVLGRGGGGATVVCDVSAVVEASAVVVEALARLRLTALRFGADLRVQGANPDLRGLLGFTGLDGALLGNASAIEAASAIDAASALDAAPALDAASALERQRQAEEREDSLDIEEVRDAADPVA